MGRLWPIVLVILPCFVFFSNKLFHQLCYTILLHHWVNSHLESCFSFTSQPILFPMSPMKKVRWRQGQRRSGNWELFGAGWSWGVFQHCLRRRHRGCFVRYLPFLSVFFFLSFGLHFSQSVHLSLILMLDSIFSFSGSELAKEGQCPQKGGPAVEVRGAAENGVSSGRIRGRGFLWAPEGSCKSHSYFLCPPPKNAILPQPPLSPSCPLRSLKRWHLKSLLLLAVRQSWHQKHSLQLRHKLQVAIPAHMISLHLQLGGIKRMYKCQVEGCMEGPSTSHAAICIHVHREHLGVGLACPSCAKTFFNSDTL